MFLALHLSLHSDKQHKHMFSKGTSVLNDSYLHCPLTLQKSMPSRGCVKTFLSFPKDTYFHCLLTLQKSMPSIGCVNTHFCVTNASHLYYPLTYRGTRQAHSAWRHFCVPNDSYLHCPLTLQSSTPITGCVKTRLAMWWLTCSLQPVQRSRLVWRLLTSSKWRGKWQSWV